MSGSILAAVTVLFTVGAMCFPMDETTTDLILPKMPNEPAGLMSAGNETGPETKWASNDNESTSATVNERKLPGILFVINILSVKNSTAEDSNDVLHSDVIEEVPSDIAVPLALFLLVIEDKDENHPVSLDDVARDFEKEGFTVEKVVKNGETLLVKVDLDTIEKTIRVPEESNEFNNLIEHEAKIQDTGKLTSVRRKRHICLSCKLGKLKSKMYHKHQGRCNRCGGRPRTVYVQPVVVQPVVYHPVYQRPPHHVHYPQQQSCNICGGGGGGYSTSYAQASASSASYGYGR